MWQIKFDLIWFEVFTVFYTGTQSNNDMFWVIFSSQELLGYPDLWNEALQAVDLLLLTDWFPQAERQLLATVQVNHL